jgi:hypothetical protein
LPGCGTLGDLSASTTSYSAICRQPSGSWLRLVARLLHSGGSPAPTTPYSALCGQALGSLLWPVAGLLRAGGSPASTTPSSALCRQPSGSPLRPVAGLRHAVGLQVSMTPYSALCWQPFGSRLWTVAGLLRAGGLPASTTPSSALCGPPMARHSAAGSAGGRMQGCCVGGLAGFDYTICCTLRAAVLGPALAGRRATARGRLASIDSTIFCIPLGRRSAAGVGR